MLRISRFAADNAGQSRYHQRVRFSTTRVWVCASGLLAVVACSEVLLLGERGAVFQASSGGVDASISGDGDASPSSAEDAAAADSAGARDAGPGDCEPRTCLGKLYA